MSGTNSEHATAANTVTVMIGSYLDMNQMISSGVIPELVADGNIGLDAYDVDMADATNSSTYQNDLVTQLASAWNGSGSGTQEMLELPSSPSGSIELTNTTNATIEVAAQGTLFYAADGSSYQSKEDPTNAAWTNGIGQTGTGTYAVAPGQTVTIPVEATYMGQDAASNAAGSIIKSSVAGLTVTQVAALSPSGGYTASSVNVTTGGNYYVDGNAYLPTLTFSAGGTTTATGHVTGLYIAGEGWLGNAGSGYVVANNVPVEDPKGNVFFTINITSIGANGAITGITLNQTNRIVTSIPGTLSIIQNGGVGATMRDTNFGVSTVAIDNAGSGYVAAPTVTFSGTAAAPPASGTVVAGESGQGSWLTTGTDDYTYVMANQGLAPAETYVNVGNATAWTSTDVASWKTYVLSARSEGVLNLAPLEKGMLAAEDQAQPFATSAFYAGLRQAALYGGGLEIQLPSYTVFTMTPTEWQTVIEEIRWSTDNGIRSSLLVSDQGSASGNVDSTFANDVTTLLQQLVTENALPSQVVVENSNTAENGSSYYDTDSSDENALNNVALSVANNYTFTPSAAEDGLEVKGTDKAQTTLVMSGVRPSEDALTAANGYVPYSTTQIFSEDPTKVLTLTVTDAARLLSLSDSMNGASAAAGGVLTFTGSASQATTFLNDLSVSAPSATAGVAALELTLTDYLGQVTQGSTEIFLGNVHPVFTSIAEASSSVLGNLAQTGDTVTFTVATSAPVTVNGLPELVLTNQALASYVGQDTNDNLVFSYTVQAGDDTAALRVRGLLLDGSTITNSATGLAIDPDSIDAAETTMANPLVVNTMADTIVGVAELATSSATLAAGDEITFSLKANNPIVAVNGTPTLELNDGGIASYAGLTSSGQLDFNYAAPAGGAYSALAPTSLDLNGAVLSNNLGETVTAPTVMPTPSSEVSYDATNTAQTVDTLVIALSADEYLGDAKAIITLNGQQIAAPIDVAAVHSAGQTQLVTLTGDFSSGVEQVGVSFTNDLWAGTVSTDRNLYIDGITLDGNTELGAAELDQTSTETAPIISAVQDKLQLWVSEDANSGNAMFSVDVDGNDLPGTYSTDVANSSGKWQELDIYGKFGTGAHTVTVTDVSGTVSGTSENGLYVEQAAINGVVQAAPTQPLYVPGETSTITLPGPKTDVLTLNVSEDAWNGDAQCFVTIDGKVFGGLTTVTASHAAGAEQAITINEAGLSSGAHTVGLSFINDAWGGTASTDRNLYLDSASLNGVNQNVSAGLLTWGTASFQTGQAPGQGVDITYGKGLLPGLGAHIELGAPTPAVSVSSVVAGVTGLHVSQGPVESIYNLSS